MWAGNFRPEPLSPSLPRQRLHSLSGKPSTPRTSPQASAAATASVSHTLTQQPASADSNTRCSRLSLPVSGETPTFLLATRRWRRRNVEAFGWNSMCSSCLPIAALETELAARMGKGMQAPGDPGGHPPPRPSFPVLSLDAARSRGARSPSPHPRPGAGVLWRWVDGAGLGPLRSISGFEC